MAYATPTDIEERLGRTLEPSEATQVATRLDDAEELIRLRIPDLDDQILAGTIRERLVVMVEAEAVMRLIRNPDGYTQETDGNYSYSISSKVASGRLTIEPDEWRLLGIRASVALAAIKINLPGNGYKMNPNYCFEAGLSPAWALVEPSDIDPGTAVWG